MESGERVFLQTANALTVVAHLGSITLVDTNGTRFLFVPDGSCTNSEGRQIFGGTATKITEQQVTSHQRRVRLGLSEKERAWEAILF